MSASFARRALPGAVAAAAAALGATTWLYLDERASPPPAIEGYVLAEPRALPSIELVDEHGAAFRAEDFAGHWSMVYFGYTYCPDVCPLTLVALANVKQELESSSGTHAPSASAHAAVGEPVEYYLVSVDPKRDTPARLREYVAYFDPSFHGLTGTPQALAELATATGTVFDVPEGQDAENYLVSHSSNVLLLDPRARVHAVFTPPHEPATLASDFTVIAARYAATQ